ncbi:MAG TPA: hypothetical protein VIU12_31805 [Chryseolinea sp.]
MKKMLTLFVALTVWTASLAQDSPYMTKSLSNETVSDVYARTSGGGITVSGVSVNETRVEVYITANNNRNTLSKEEIKAKLEEDYNLTLSVSGHKVTAVAEPKHSNMNWKQALNISFKIYVPQNVSTDLSTSGGGIDLTNLSGTHNFSTSGGGLELVKLTGTVRGKTSGGGISLADSGGDISLSTSGGGIDVDDCSGQIRLNTSGGSIRLNRLDGTIDASTSGGPVRGDNIKGELTAHTSGGGVTLRALACSVDASTSGGNMEVEISQLGKYVTVSNSGGNVNLSLPPNQGLNLKLRGNKIKTNNLSNFSGEMDEDNVNGKINGGGIPVNVQSSGNVTVAIR